MSEQTVPKPCIVCGVQLEPAMPFDDCGHLPYAGTMFDCGSGHYGSTVWDTMDESLALEIVVCDACLLKHRDRVQVVEVVRQRPDVLRRSWDPDGRD